MHTSVEDLLRGAFSGGEQRERDNRHAIPTRQTRPKILDRDPAAWINQPPTDEIQLAA